MASSRPAASPRDAPRSFGGRRCPPRRARPGFVAALGVGLVGALVCLWIHPASGQPGPVGEAGLELGVHGGVFAPAGDLVGAREGETFGSVGAARSLVLGATAGLRLPGGFLVEAQGAWIPDADLEDEEGRDFGEMSLLTLTAAGLYRPSLPGIGAFVQPFLGGGAGVKRYSFDPAVFSLPVGGVESPGDLDLEGEETDFTLELLAGARVTLLPGFRVRLEVRDYLSGFDRGDESEFQHDFTFLAGAGVGVP